MARTTRSRKEGDKRGSTSAVKTSARGKKRSAAAAEEPVQDEEPEQPEAQDGAPAPTAAVPRTDRREQMAQIAQRCCSRVTSVAFCLLLLRALRDSPAALQTSCPLRYVPDGR